MRARGVVLRYKLGGPRRVYVGLGFLWEFPEIRCPLFGAPYNMNPAIFGTRLGSPIFSNSQASGGL